MSKDCLDITGDCFSRRYAVSWSSCFHQRLKAMIVNYLKGPFTLSDPLNHLHTSVTMRSKLWRVRKCSPGLSHCVLSVTVSHLSFGDTLKSGCNRRIHWHLSQGLMSDADVLCIVSSSHGLLYPTEFCVFAKIPCGFGITSEVLATEVG